MAIDKLFFFLSLTEFSILNKLISFLFFWVIETLMKVWKNWKKLWKQPIFMFYQTSSKYVSITWQEQTMFSIFFYSILQNSQDQPWGVVVYVMNIPEIKKTIMTKIVSSNSCKYQKLEKKVYFILIKELTFAW